MTAGSHTHGARVIQTFAGSLVNTRNGVGAESSATTTTLSRSARPIVFHSSTTTRERRPLASQAPTTSAENPVTMSKLRPA